jgi:hypothetical protein
MTHDFVLCSLLIFSWLRDSDLGFGFRAFLFIFIFLVDLCSDCLIVGNFVVIAD